MRPKKNRKQSIWFTVWFVSHRLDSERLSVGQSAVFTIERRSYATKTKDEQTPHVFGTK